MLLAFTCLQFWGLDLLFHLYLTTPFLLAHCPLPGVCVCILPLFFWLHLVLINSPRWNWTISPCYATTYIIHHYQFYPSSTLAPSIQILPMGFRINWDPLFISSQLSLKCWPLSAVWFSGFSIRLRAIFPDVYFQKCSALWTLSHVVMRPDSHI